MENADDYIIPDDGPANVQDIQDGDEIGALECAHDEENDSDDHVIDYLMESSDEEEALEQYNEAFSVHDALRRWAISRNQTYESIEEVMDIVRKTSNCKLPKDARTLLKINRNPSAEITTVEGGQYWYHGIQKCFNELR